MSQHQLTRDLETVLTEVNTLLSSLSSDGTSAGVQERAVRALESAKKRLVELSEDVKDKATCAAKTADDYVHDRPWQAVAAAAATGLLIGMWSGRR